MHLTDGLAQAPAAITEEKFRERSISSKLCPTVTPKEVVMTLTANLPAICVDTYWDLVAQT